MIFSVCYKITGNYFDAEDIAQETFLTAYQNYDKFDGNNEKAWICRIATNKAIDFKRKASNKQIPMEDEFFSGISDQSSSVEENALETQVKERILEVCKSLKPPYDTVALEYFYEELTVGEIAVKLKRNQQTVKTQVHRAKRMMQKMYERSGAHE